MLTLTSNRRPTESTRLARRPNLLGPENLKPFLMQSPQTYSPYLLRRYFLCVTSLPQPAQLRSWDVEGMRNSSRVMFSGCVRCSTDLATWAPSLPIAGLRE